METQLPTRERDSREATGSGGAERDRLGREWWREGESRHFAWMFRTFVTYM
jgi:hypothetical protein